MDEAQCLQLALDTAQEIDSTVRPPGMKAGPLRGKLGDALKWLRGQGIPWAQILAKLPQIIAAFAAGDWITIITTLISLFNLPANTAIPPG